jgi:hypothetical protein
MATIKDFSGVVLRTNEAKDKVEQKLARTIKQQVVNSLADLLGVEYEVSNTKNGLFVKLPMQDTSIFVEFKAIVKNLDFTPESE